MSGIIDKREKRPADGARDSAPTRDAPEVAFTDLFDLDEIQAIQDTFSAATGLASLITEPDGTPITRPSNFCHLCMDLIRGTEVGRAHCLKSDALIGAPNHSGPVIQPCLSGGLWDAGASITAGGQHVANWLIGQVRNEEQDDEAMLAYADEIGVDRQVFAAALADVPSMPLERFELIAQMLFLFANELSLIAYQKLEQERLLVESENRREALRENEALLATILDAVPQSIFLKDADGVYIACNAPFAANAGVSAPADIVGKTDRDLSFSKEDAAMYRADDEAVLKSGVAKTHILEQVRRADGTTIWVDTSKFPLGGGSGAPGAVLGVFEDITERKATEDELRASESRLAALFSNAPLGYQSLDDEGRFIDVNEAWLELLGFGRDEVIGKWFGDFLAPEFRDAFRERFPVFKARGAIHSEFEMLHSDGTRHLIAFEGRVGHNPDGTFKQTHCILSDVTERRRSEEALRDTQERLQAILDNTPALVYVKDLSGRFVLVNREFERLFGLGHGDAVGRSTTDLVGEEIGAVHWANDLKVIASRESLTDEEVNDEADGRHTYLSVKFPLFGADGEVQAVCGISVDITKQKAFEQELQERNRFIEAVLENTPIGFGVNTIDDGKTVLISSNFERIYGVQPDAVEGVEDFFEKVYVDPVFREAMRERIMADLSSGDPTRMRWEDIPITSRAGDVHYVTAINIPVFDQNLMISTVQDVTDRKLAQEEVIRQKERLDRTLTSVIDIASTIVETRDPYTAGHQRRVAQIATRIASELGMAERDIADIEVAALIHDVGKVQIPAEILGKPGAISPLEYEILKGHAEAGYRIVSSANMEAGISEMVYEHHERCDGSGYPRHLADGQISMGAKVLAVSDVVEAMMSHRPYRPALGVEAALAEIERGAGQQYDTAVVNACVSIFRDQGFQPS